MLREDKQCRIGEKWVLLVYPWHSWSESTECGVWQKGSQQVCLETGGIHELHFHQPCVFFGAHSFDFDTANPSVSFVLLSSVEQQLLVYTIEDPTFWSKSVVSWNYEQTIISLSSPIVDKSQSLHDNTNFHLSTWWTAALGSGCPEIFADRTDSGGYQSLACCWFCWGLSACRHSSPIWRCSVP